MEKFVYYLTLIFRQGNEVVFKFFLKEGQVEIQYLENEYYLLLDSAVYFPIKYQSVTEYYLENNEEVVEKRVFYYQHIFHPKDKNWKPELIIQALKRNAWVEKK